MAAVNLDWHGDRSGLPALRLIDREPPAELIDLGAVRRYRLGRVRARMAERGIVACVLLDPVNIRYATGARNMQVYHLRSPSRYLLITLDGPVVLFEFAGCMHLAEGLETIDEVRPALTASFVAAGPGIAERERRWASEMARLIRRLCGSGGRVGVERVNAGAAVALASEGFSLVDAQEPVERARAVKSAEELKCIRASIAATERAVGALRAALRPGLTENVLWSILHQGVIGQGGDYCETRLLTSGRHTNPWFQETGEKPIAANELVALDTDVVGCYGYYCDFSRTFHVGPDEPSRAQKELYRHAHEQVRHNIDVIRPGMTFREYADRAWEIPERYLANRYYVSAHGCGMTGEYPHLHHRIDFEAAGYDGVIEPAMTLCVESYIGEQGGAEGVKLEQQCLVTDRGLEPLSRFPFEDRLL
jgi:Xaa-Pro dipeptidase